MADERTAFDPNRLTFEQGAQRVADALKAHGFDKMQRIVTSIDPEMGCIVESLRTKNVPEGFHKWQLPIVFDKAQMFISVAPPNAIVPRHAHDEDGVRLIMSGSILFDGAVLKAGDWMLVPGGMPYSFQVGPFGASMFYCYKCCCA